MLYLIAIFGGLLPAFFGAVKYWRRSHVNANCWFCGLNNIILKKCQDGWICRHCDQYNGFKPDGDYNRDIPAQWDSSLNQRLSYCSTPKTAPKFSNGLCQECNRNQEVKIAQLASFCPINPENFEYEIDNFSYHLERAYRLCPPCEMVLEEILSRKKTHVLDMNLQLTGKNNQRSKFIASKQGFSTLVQTNLFLTTLLIVLVVLSILYTIPSDHSKIIGVGNKEEVISELSFSYPPSYLSLLLPTPPVCPQLEFDYLSNRKPDLRLQKILEAYFEGVRLFILPLSVSGLVIQGISSWFTGGRLTLLLWLALIGTVSFGDIANEKLEHLQQCPILEITLAVFILIFSWREAIVQKRKSLQIKKHLTGNITSKLPKRTVGSIAGNGLLSSNTIKFPAQMTTSNQTLSAPVGIPGQEFSTLDTTNYLNLPSRPSSVSSHRTLTSASGLFDNCTVSPAVDTPSAQYQEDARSDASIDSAFSNADSITLDAVDAFNGSSPLLLGRNKDSEGDVHSLIEGLSLGPCKSKNLKKPAEFKTKSYLLDKKRQSLLSPAKLTNIMNESVASGIWRNTNNICKWTEGSKQKQCPSYGFDSPCSQAAILSPGSTKTGSLICSSRPITPMNMLSVATVPSKSSTGISNSGFSVSATPTPNGTLSQTVMPPSTIVSNAGFGTAVSSGPISPTPHIVYTPFGLYHQVVGPYGNPVYMMPSQSPIFSNSSPSCSLGSQFSPQSCSRSSHNDLNSFYESDSLSSPKSTHFKTRINSKLSTSFLESVWQSRYAILYTTLCYLMAGTVVYMFSYNGLILSVPSTLTKWKEQLLLFLTEV